MTVKTQTTHTPIPPTPAPWKVVGPDKWEVECSDGFAPTTHFLGDVVASKARNQANAEFICRAVNSHDDLVAALIEARTEISRINQSAQETVFNPAVTELIDAALQKADGGV